MFYIQFLPSMQILNTLWNVSEHFFPHVSAAEFTARKVAIEMSLLLVVYGPTFLTTDKNWVVPEQFVLACKTDGSTVECRV